eukprot:COSAG01_NODE_3952_length_5500_cov_202.781337_5_plen_57_part_00
MTDKLDMSLDDLVKKGRPSSQHRGGRKNRSGGGGGGAAVVEAEAVMVRALPLAAAA